MFAGFDFGTSGARTIVIDREGRVKFAANTSYQLQDEGTWRTALYSLILQIPLELRQALQGIGIDGTSGTFVGCDGTGVVKIAPQLYNDPRGKPALEFLRSICPEQSVVLSSTSTLARLISLAHQGVWDKSWHLVHHCDRIAYFLHHCQDYTDWHNALKLGYDPIGLNYPPAIADLGFKLPSVVPPGTPIAPIHFQVAQELGINPLCQICSGTTDSNSAFLAAVGYHFRQGTAVTSLGSTLTVKILGDTPIFDPSYGIYSHRWTINDQTFWLAGGASNSGGAVLSHFFTNAELVSLSQQIDPAVPTSLDYYPLLQPGERFPICDPHLPPRLSPRPDRDHLFLQGMLEGVARIERLGYDRLQELGAPPIGVLYTVGAGGQNPVWQAIRQRLLQVPFAPPVHSEAAYGSALLAHHNIQEAALG